MRVAVIQHDIAWEDGETTRSRLERPVASAAAGGARLIVLTEMFATGFSMRTDRTAESIDGPTVTWMHQQAAEHGAWLAGSLPIRDDGYDRPANSLLIVGAEGVRARYDKIHPFSYADEHEHFRSGDDDVTVTLDGVRWHLSVCYDLRFADQYWRAASGVDAYLVVANWPSARRTHWQRLLPARAIENQAYVVAANRVGRAGKLDYAGDSVIIDPLGEILAAGAGAETILQGEIDAATVTDVRESLPFLPDR